MMSDKLAGDAIEVITGLKRRIDTTLDRVREMACPAPMKLHPDDRTTGGCFDRGQCGCVHGGTASERKQPLPKECPSCSYLKPAKVHACPACGFAPATQSSVATADGDIARVDGKMMAASRAARQRWYSEVLWICRERGYKPGWAANQYREKFGVWPRGLDDVPSQPGPEVASWVKSRLIRYANGRAKGAHRAGAAA